MYKPSPELAAIVKRWIEAIPSKDTDTVINMLSDSEALRYVGSDEKELWSGDLLRRGLGDHFQEVPEFHYRDTEVEAFENGDCGWALWHGGMYFPSTGVQAFCRVTFVFVLERGLWKIVQCHISNPMPNKDKIGIEHEALESLMAAAEKGSLGLGTEGMATIMFTDVADSSALAELVGDREWITRIEAHFSSIRQSVKAHGGTLVKSLGDGTMSTFQSTRAAISAAREIQARAGSEKTEPELRLRIGLHTGEVIENKGDFFGTVVNKAARISAVSDPDEIWISDATRIMLGRVEGVSFGTQKDVSLKGIEGQHRLYQVEV